MKISKKQLEVEYMKTEVHKKSPTKSFRCVKWTLDVVRESASLDNLADKAEAITVETTGCQAQDYVTACHIINSWQQQTLLHVANGRAREMVFTIFERVR